MGTRDTERRRPSGTDGSRRRSKRRRRRAGCIKYLILFVIMVLIIGAAAAAFLWKRYSPTKEKADLKQYYGVENNEQVAVVTDNEVIGPKGKIIDGEAYVEYSTVRDAISSRFYWDVNENIMLYTLPNDMVTVAVGSKEYSISKEKKSEDYIILKTEGNTAYIALDFIKEYVNIDFKVYDKTTPKRIVIQSKWGETSTAEVKKDTQVRYRAGVKSPVLTEVKKNDSVVVLESEGGWKKVRSADGFIGYIKNSALRDVKKEKVTHEFNGVKDEDYTNITKPYTINLAWHQVTSEAANKGVLETIAGTKGLTTISPTWFSVADNDGTLKSIASQEYVNYAHQSNIEVWALVDNFSENVDSLELLSYTSRRVNLENQLIAEALKYGIDGINVDFEKISEEAGEHFIQFVRELSVKCRQNGLVLSVDNYVPKGYTAHYYREEQGKVADYVIVMGYDEHFAGSYESGSVASIDFVKEGIEETIKQVPAEKVINAVPFYTRLWKEVPKTKEELQNEKGTEAAEYSTTVTSEAIGMDEAKKRIAAAGAETTWDEKTQQNYAEWEADGATYKIWLEDTQSIEAKLKLMKENKIAGTAAWKLGFETSDIWDLILKYVN